MKGILSVFSTRRKLRKKQTGEEDKALPLLPEPQTALPSVPEPDRPDGESSPEKSNGTGAAVKAAADPEGDGAGPIRRITEFIRNLAVRTEETIREVTGTESVSKNAEGGNRAGDDSRIFSSAHSGNAGAEEARTVRPEAAAEEISGSGAGSSIPVPGPGKPLKDSVNGGRDELYSIPEFRAEVREDDIPFRRGGFTDETSGGWKDNTQESFRFLLDRTDEMKEILSRLGETADEIRKELTI